MTLLIATLTTDACWFSTDMLVLNELHPMPGPDDAAYCGDHGGGPHTVSIIDTRRKIMAGRNIMAMGAGRLLSVTDWLVSSTCADDIDAAIKICLPPSDVGLIAGWSERDDCIRAYALMHGEPVKLEAGRHTIQPEPDDESPQYDVLYRAQESARHGVNVPEFHQLIALNVHAAYLAGRMRPGIAIGREIITVRLDRSGVHEL